ncbi:MAG: LuxR C-terminal-related transcriptional regulator [Vogesella sp.]|uniref:helix-turn-helix domain-containing protein n=1 Tax=Vogesella sp. TaxID=1904252 RepID=UPI0039195757
MSKGIPFACGSISAGLTHAQLSQLLEWIHGLPSMADDKEMHTFLPMLGREAAVAALWITHGQATPQGWQAVPRNYGLPAACHSHDWQRLPDDIGQSTTCFWLTHTSPATACFALQRDGFATLLYVQPYDAEAAATLRMLGSLLPHLHATLQRLVPAPSGVNPLSHREKDIFHWMMRGKTNWEIATILDISERTVKFHAANIIRKLEANNRTHAIVLGIQKGLAA